jgi:hypothetical protein
MKKFLVILLVLALGAFVVWKFVFKRDKGPSGPKPVGMAVSKHSDAFIRSMNKMLDSYYLFTEAFVNWDTAAVNKTSGELKMSIDSMKLEEMKKDSAIYPTVESQWTIIKAEISGLIADSLIEEKRESLNMLSQQLFDLLRIVKYDASVVYYQECPMALNDYESSGFWLSTEAADDKRRNPYLGLHDPKYGKGMLICGNTRDSVNFVTTVSTGN